MDRVHAPALSGSGELSTVDYHTAGEPFRIVLGGVDAPQGATVIERRSWAQEHLDDVRALLVNEPRGHADMYGGFVTPPDDPGAAFGAVFFHKDGFSTACGHGTIALATWAVDSGRVKAPQDMKAPQDKSAASKTSSVDRGVDRCVDAGAGSENTGAGTVEMAIDVPSGRLRAVAALDDERRVDSVRFWNVDAFVSARSIEVATTRGVFRVDVAYGGAFYGSVCIEGSDGLEPTRRHLTELIDIARQIKSKLAGHPAVRHDDSRLSGLYGVIFHQDLGRDPLQQRNVTVFADGEVDRSPCGSGTSAQLAVLVAQGRLRSGDRFVNRGVAGAEFDARVEAVTERDGRRMVSTSVAGSAYKTAESRFTLDARDPLGLGFQLR